MQRWPPKLMLFINILSRHEYISDGICRDSPDEIQKVFCLLFSELNVLAEKENLNASKIYETVFI